MSFFLQAINEKRKIMVTFFSNEDGHSLKRLCAPFDYGPSNKYKVKSPRYHMYDYTSDSGSHVLSILPGQLKEILLTDEYFNPLDLVTWNNPKWHVQRNWGIVS
ncbi:hypothetical protein [Paenibacillus xylanexedens]|uniref:hypothetical protein n=1 Tax=Paenibacillus xylanexedens TaxID=528191 RepID=UPI003B0284E6